MKKVIKCALGLGMVVTMMSPIHAEEPSEGEETRVTTLTYTRNSNYILSIPQTIAISGVEEVSQKVGVSQVNTNATEKVQIKVKDGVGAEGKITLNRQGAGAGVTTEITASLESGGNGISADAVVAEFWDQDHETPKKGGTLYFSKIPESAQAGDYEGTITFVASVVEREEGDK